MIPEYSSGEMLQRYIRALADPIYNHQDILPRHFFPSLRTNNSGDNANKYQQYAKCIKGLSTGVPRHLFSLPVPAAVP
jgi:hypothetical protein